MKLFRWQRGRLPCEVGGYSILPLFFSRRLKMDLYVLKVLPGTSIPPHVDPAPAGHVHLRWNFPLTFASRWENVQVMRRWIKAHARYRINAGEQVHWFQAWDGKGAPAAYYLSFGRCVVDYGIRTVNDVASTVFTIVESAPYSEESPESNWMWVTLGGETERRFELRWLGHMLVREDHDANPTTYLLRCADLVAYRPGAGSRPAQYKVRYRRRELVHYPQPLQQ